MRAPDARKRIVREVAGWPGVVASPHRFGGVEFKVGRRELGHVHGDRQADIPFPMNVRNQLVADGKAEPHHVLPESGRVTFRLKEELDVEKAIGLSRACYELVSRKS